MNIVYFNAEKFYRLAFEYFHYENNLDLAQKYINKALKSNKNHIKSILLKGEICLVKNNLKEASKYIKMSADLGCEKAILKYAEFLETGFGVERNLEEAKRYRGMIINNDE